MDNKCCGKECMYYEYFYVTFDGKKEYLNERCVYANKVLWNEASRVCPLRNNHE